jgi:hypothetical protein
MEQNYVLFFASEAHEASQMALSPRKAGTEKAKIDSCTDDPAESRNKVDALYGAVQCGRLGWS